MRRVILGDLARGLSTWLDQYWASRRERQLLRAAATRMKVPALAKCYEKWHRDWEETQRRDLAHGLAEAQRQWAKEEAEKQAAVSKLEAEKGKLALERVATDDERRALMLKSRELDMLQEQEKAAIH